MPTTRRTFLGSLLAPAAVALLAACGPSAPQATSSGAAASTPAPTPVPSKPGAVAPVNPVATTAPASKPSGPTGTLNVAVPTEPATLDRSSATA